jgi:hypothetical protein
MVLWCFPQTFDHFGRSHGRNGSKGGFTVYEKESQQKHQRHVHRSESVSSRKTPVKPPFDPFRPWDRPKWWNAFILDLNYPDPVNLNEIISLRFFWGSRRIRSRSFHTMGTSVYQYDCRTYRKWKIYVCPTFGRMTSLPVTSLSVTSHPVAMLLSVMSNDTFCITTIVRKKDRMHFRACAEYSSGNDVTSGQVTSCDVTVTSQEVTSKDRKWVIPLGMWS